MKRAQVGSLAGGDIACRLGLAACGVAIGVFALASCDASSGPAPARVSSSAAATASGGAAADVRVWSVETGDVFSYAVRVSSSVHVGNDLLTTLRVSGDLDVTLVNVLPSARVFHARMRHPKLEVERATKLGRVVEYERELEQPFLVELSNDGALSTVRFSQQPSALTVAEQESLAASLQGSESGGRSSWLTEESDGTGRYESRYELAPDALHLKRTKTKYLNLAASATGARTDTAVLLPTVESSEGTLELGSRGEVESVTFREKLRSGTSQMVPVVSETELSLRSERQGHVALSELPEWASIEKNAGYDPSHPWKSLRDDPADDDQARVKGRSLDQVLAELRKIEAEKPPSTEGEQGAHDRRRADLFGALEGLIRQKPGTVAALSRLVLRKDPISTVLTDALGASGSAEAQRALTKLLEQRRNLSAPWSKDAAIALSMTPAPSPDTVAELTSLLSDPVLGTQAMYGLGTSARHLREGGHSAEASEIVGLILSRLRAAATPVQQVVALRAVANAGDGVAYPAVEPLLTAKNDDVRTAAVESLQLMRGAEIDAKLAGSIAADPSAEVRLAAARAARNRPPSESLEAAIATAALRDRDPNVRLGALRVLTKWLPDFPTAAGTVKEVADDDQEDAIRREARAALTSQAG